MDHWSWKYIERPKRIITSRFHKLFKIDNAKIIQIHVNKHRNELVYDSPFEVVRLLGWTDQFEDDYFWIVYHQKNGVQLHSCVGGFVWLKGKLSLFDYHQADEVFSMNCPSSEIILNMLKQKDYIVK